MRLSSNLQLFLSFFLLFTIFYSTDSQPYGRHYQQQYNNQTSDYHRAIDKNITLNEISIPNTTRLELVIVQQDNRVYPECKMAYSNHYKNDSVIGISVLSILEVNKDEYDDLEGKFCKGQKENYLIEERQLIIQRALGRLWIEHEDQRGDQDDYFSQESWSFLLINLEQFKTHSILQTAISIIIYYNQIHKPKHFNNLPFIMSQSKTLQYIKQKPSVNHQQKCLQEQVKTGSIQEQFNMFNREIFVSLKKRCQVNKETIKRNQHDLANRLLKIQYESKRLKLFLDKQQKRFNETVQQVSIKDKSILQDYEQYFCKKVLQLQQLYSRHYHHNLACKSMVEKKRKELESILKQIYQGQFMVLEKQQDRQCRGKANRSRSKSLLSVILMNHSLKINVTSRKRTRTELSEYRDSRSLIKHSKADLIMSSKKSYSYLEPIKKIKTQEKSVLPLLKTLLIESKKNIKENEKNWFLQLLYNDRSFNKLIKFINFHSKQRKIKKILQT